MVALRRRKINPRGLEFIGNGYRALRREGGAVFGRKRGRKGEGKKDFDSIG